MSTKIIVSGNEIKDEDVSKILFNVDPTDDSTITEIKDTVGYLTLWSEDTECFIDKHSIDNLILALQEAKRLWGDK